MPGPALRVVGPPDAEHVRARAGDHADAGTPGGGRRPRADDVVNDDPLLRARFVQVAVDRVGVGPGHRKHGRPELGLSDAGAHERLIGGVEHRFDRQAGADGILVAGARVPEVQAALVEVEHGGQRLRGAAVDAKHIAHVRPGGGVRVRTRTRPGQRRG